MPKTKSKKQIAFLLSSGSLLSAEQKAKLKRELHRGTVRVKKKEKGWPKRDANGFY